MSDRPLIYSVIPKMIADCEAIEKDRKNTQQGWMFRGIDQVYGAVSPLFAKHGCFVTTTVQHEQREERASKHGGVIISVRLTCLFRFYATDGSYVESLIIGEAMDSGDKATNKALSIAYKIAMFQLLCIPTASVDPDYDTHEPASREPPPPPAKPAAKPAPPPALTAAEQVYVTDALAEIAACESEELLLMMADQIKTKSEAVRAALRPMATARLGVLRTKPAEEVY